jgi:phenylacetic acid degradation operon negative regulatory protein
MIRKRNTVETAAEEATAMLERPLGARSLVLSLLLGRHPPEAPVALLVRWCGLFGVSSTSARVALSRMVERGELTAADGDYALAGRLVERQADQDQALTPAVRPWNGEWLMAIVDDGRRDAADRVALRDALRRARLVPWRDAVWLRPDNIDDPAATAADREVIARQCTWWRATPLAPIDVGAAYDLPRLLERGTRLRELIDSAIAVLPDPAALAPAFVVGAATAQHLRRDPLLPPALLPAGWPADELRERYARFTAVMDQAIAAWLAT